MPMATPMSARFNAGASLTPSPVMATNCPLSCRALTIFSFCSGATRAYTLMCSTFCSNSSSVSAASSLPVMASSRPSSVMPSLLAIARAVPGWSPVIITGRMPAAMHTATASFASSRGGSIMPIRPSRVSPFSTCPGDMSPGSASHVRMATPSTRRPSSDMRSLTLRISAA